MFRERLFGTWERGWTTVSIVLSVLSIILTIVLWGFPESTPILIIGRDLILAGGTIFLIMMLTSRAIRLSDRVRLRERQIAKLKEDISKHIKNPSITMSNYKNKTFKYFWSIMPGNLNIEMSENELKLFTAICGFVTEIVKKSLLDYFDSRGIDIDDDISVTVKLILPSEKVIEVLSSNNALSPYQQQQIHTKDRWIITVYRDHYTYTNKGQREVNSDIYDIGNNTAFHHIINLKRDCFVNNNLKSLEDQDQYTNDNKKWREHYNSTIVVPIKYVDEHAGQQVTYGLLAVDSLNASGISDLYNDKECKYILEHAANLLANFFLSLALLHYTSPQRESAVNS